MNPPFVPTVTIDETIATNPGPQTLPLYACVIGPQAQLVRYGVAAEQANGLLGGYDPYAGGSYAWPKLAPGGAVDLDDPALALWCKGAKLAFFDYPAGSAETVAMVAQHPNRVAITGSAGFAAGGGAQRLAGLYGRDVAVGDRVRLSATASGTTTTLDTYVTALVGDATAAVVAAATADASNAPTQAAATTTSQTAGAVNCWALAADGTAYDGLAAGHPAETYTVAVIRGSTGNDPTTALLSITSASGTDDASAVAPAAADAAFAAGARGLTLTFSTSGGPCDLVVGQAWQVRVAQAFTATPTTSGGTYTGTAVDTYIATVTRGGLLADADSPPLWAVSTARGLDSGGPTAITQAGAAIPIGSRGVTLKLGGRTATLTATVSGGVVTAVTVVDGGSGYSATSPPALTFAGAGTGASATAVVAGGAVTGVTGLVGGTGYASAPTVTAAAPPAVTALCAGDRFYVPVTPAGSGRLGTLQLADNLPAPLQAASDLALTLYAERDVAIPAYRPGAGAVANWTASADTLAVAAGMATTLAGFADDAGSALLLPVIDGTLYASYRAWLPGAAAAVGATTDASTLGAVDADNPLGFGVALALANSGGLPVKYIGVADPTAQASWSAALAKLAGRTDVYKLAPLTLDRGILALVQAHVDTQSGPEQGCNRSAFFGVAPAAAQQVVGAATSSDGAEVLATLSASSGTNYNVVTITSGNARLLDLGVQPGDQVRYAFGVSGGATIYATYTVAAVTSQTTLTLATSAAAPASVGQLVEVWHTLTADEQVSDLIAQASAFADPRVCAVYSDLLGGEGGAPRLSCEYLACALAGLRSGAPPHMSLTGVPVAGLAAYVDASGALDGTQVGTLCANGVWVVTRTPQVAAGAPITRLATTTLPGTPPNVATREEMVRSNVDSMELYIRQDLLPYVSQTNMVAEGLAAIRTQLVAAHTFLKSSGRTDRLGGQLVSYTLNAIAQHAVLLDTLVIDANWVVPGPINAITFNVTLVVGSNVSAATAAPTA